MPPNQNLAIEINGLYKKFSDHKSQINVFQDFSLQIEKSKITAILGPNGCGKSTLIDIVLGLESFDSGSIKIDGEDFIKSSGKIGVVFQGLGLFPWLSVKTNLLFGVKNKSTNLNFENLADKYLKRYELDKFINSPISTLSGGMQQKLALARVLITNPEIFILDEPFSALDPISKSKVIDEVKNINIMFKKTIVFVTHNIQEALELGENIIVLNTKPISRALLFKNDQGQKTYITQEIRKAISTK